MFRSILAVSVLATTVAAIPSQQKDIVDTAVAAGSFKTLVAAVQAADLVDTLKGEGPFTVFAPTDEAFSKIPKEVLADLLKPENKKQLQSILTYHVVPGRVLAGDLLKTAEAKTVQGSPARFSLSVENAKIVKTDIKCSNGVIHVIDAVIMPPKMSSKPAPKSSAATNPQKMIRDVVAKGSQIYNSGHHHECADLYTSAMTKLTKMDSIDCGMREEMKRSMRMADATTDSNSRAWVLRRGLDSVYHRLASNGH